MNTVDKANLKEINRIFELQSEYQWKMRLTSAEERIQRLQKLKAALQKYEKDICAALLADLGKAPEVTLQADIHGCYVELDDAIANLAQWMSPESITTSAIFPEGKAKVIYEPLGIVLLFGPWNFPFNLVFQPLIQIISAGNCAIVKPNEVSCETGKLSAKIIREVFDEAEVAVFEGGVDLANALLDLPVNHIFFTGSPAVGKLVMAAAAKHLASVTLELGGKNPVVIDRSANIEEAAAKVAAYRSFNSGQVCLCPENVWVPEESKDEFIAVVQATFQAMFYQDGQLNAQALGKMIDERNFSRVTSYIRDAVEKGAQVICGGDSNNENKTIQPTLLVNVPENAVISQEEVFGPILCLYTYKHVDEVVSVLRSQPKPLALYIFSQLDSFVNQILESTSSGGVTINDCMMHYAEHNLPFGGVNNSGIGRYHGIHGFKELSHERAVLYVDGRVK